MLRALRGKPRVSGSVQSYDRLIVDDIGLGGLHAGQHSAASCKKRAEERSAPLPELRSSGLRRSRPGRRGCFEEITSRKFSLRKVLRNEVPETRFPAFGVLHLLYGAIAQADEGHPVTISGAVTKLPPYRRDGARWRNKATGWAKPLPSPLGYRNVSLINTLPERILDNGRYHTQDSGKRPMIGRRLSYHGRTSRFVSARPFTSASRPPQKASGSRVAAVTGPRLRAGEQNVSSLNKPRTSFYMPVTESCCRPWT